MKLIEQGQKDYWHYYNLIDNEIVGCVYIHQTDVFFISHFLIDTKYRHKGYGTHLMNLIIKKAKDSNVTQIVLEVNKNNIEAISFYNKFEFEVDEDACGTKYRLCKSCLL